MSKSVGEWKEREREKDCKVNKVNLKKVKEFLMNNAGTLFLI